VIVRYYLEHSANGAEGAQHLGAVSSPQLLTANG